MEQQPNKSRTILITGGAGFIGSNFIVYYLSKYTKDRIVNLDKLTYAGNMSNLKEVTHHQKHVFIEGDICDSELVNQIFLEYEVDGVIHFAAETHVDNSILSPRSFIKTNVEGTFVLLEAAKNYWMNAPFKFKKGYEHARFHHISTDEVYGSLGERGFFTENTPYAPNSPYSASKASSDFLVRSYYHTFGLNVVTTNCSNNYGPRQHDEKLIPTIIRKALNGKKIPIYGDGSNIRDWLNVNDHCEGISVVFKKGITGETYLLGGNNEKNNLDIAKQLCFLLDIYRPKSTGSYCDQITFVEDRPGHDFRYGVDISKMNRELGWYPKVKFDVGLDKTVLWFLNKYQI